MDTPIKDGDDTCDGCKRPNEVCICGATEQPVSDTPIEPHPMDDAPETRARAEFMDGERIWFVDMSFCAQMERSRNVARGAAMANDELAGKLRDELAATQRENAELRAELSIALQSASMLRSDVSELRGRLSEEKRLSESAVSFANTLEPKLKLELARAEAAEATVTKLRTALNAIVSYNTPLPAGLLEQAKAALK